MTEGWVVLGRKYPLRIFAVSVLQVHLRMHWERLVRSDLSKKAKESSALQMALASLMPVSPKGSSSQQA